MSRLALAATLYVLAASIGCAVAIARLTKEAAR